MDRLPLSPMRLQFCFAGVLAMTWRQFIDKEWLPLSLITFWVIFWLAVFAETF
jgi:hypothetical protein